RSKRWRRASGSIRKTSTCARCASPWASARGRPCRSSAATIPSTFRWDWRGITRRSRPRKRNGRSDHLSSSRASRGTWREGGAPPAPPDPSLTLGMTTAGAVTVIIPTLNDEDWLAEAIDSAFAAGAAEVIVADAASVDRTPRIAKAHSARLLLAEGPRARQLNAAVQAAAHDNLVILHADTRLPAGAAEAVAAALREVAFGGLRIAFIEPSMRLKIA